MTQLDIALVGDHDETILAHQAIPQALELAARQLGVDVTGHWVDTDRLATSLAPVSEMAGVWCVPASPYRSAAGALAAIARSRRNGSPFLGTCGGFQHAVLECAAALWGVADPAHAELDAGDERPVIAPLRCSLVEARGGVSFLPGSRIAKAYGRLESVEGYHCSYGLNPDYAHHLAEGPLRATAWDESGDVRAVELDDHPFFVATLFQPERAALAGVAPPIVTAFLAAATVYRAATTTGTT